MIHDAGWFFSVSAGPQVLPCGPERCGNRGTLLRLAMFVWVFKREACGSCGRERDRFCGHCDVCHACCNCKVRGNDPGDVERLDEMIEDAESVLREIEAETEDETK